jgi:hypothetical protein
MYTHEDIFKLDNFRTYKRVEWKRLERVQSRQKNQGLPITEDVFEG